MIVFTLAPHGYVNNKKQVRDENMLKRTFVLASTAAALLTLSLNLNAESATGLNSVLETSPFSVPLNAAQLQTEALPLLTKARVAQWIEGFKKARERGGETWLEQSQNGEQTLAQTMANASNAKAYRDFSNDLVKIGFSDTDEWSAVGVQVMQAYAALAVDTQGVDQHVQKAIADVEANESLSAQQKQFMIGMIKSGAQAAVAVSQAPEQNKQAVKAHMLELKAIIDEQSK
jgi:hypothetical protein